MWFDIRGNLHPTAHDVAVYVETPGTHQWHQIKYDIGEPLDPGLENKFKELQAKYDDMVINFDKQVTELKKHLHKTTRERDALRRELAARVGKAETKPGVPDETRHSKRLKFET